MGAMAAAWRLSEPGWQDQFESITIYQRGARLGGKGASSRGAHGRAEEHGLHVWLGYYDNAFHLLRECYDELDRTRNAPQCPIRTIDDALKPSIEVGLFDDDGGDWEAWLGRLAVNDLLPGDPGSQSMSFTGADIVRRSLQLLQDFYDSNSVPSVEPTVAMTTSPTPPMAATPLGEGISTTVLGAAIEALAIAQQVIGAAGVSAVLPVLDETLESIRKLLVDVVRESGANRRMWYLVSVVVAQVRGILAEGLMWDNTKFSTINDTDYREWVIRHGAEPEAANSSLIRGLYDLVFGYEDGDPGRPGFGAGLGVFLSAKTFLDYKGAIFWKMQAGMGEVVFAPLYEALVRRGVRFEFFHRVDSLHVDDTATGISAITLGRQAALAAGQDTYDPLVEIKGLPVFPERPRVEQLVDCDDIHGIELERAWCDRADVESVRLVRGRDFDDVVFAIPIGMARRVCGELIGANRAWADMCANLGTVATQAVQLWMRDPEPELGWDVPGSTMSAFAEPLQTWASMPQVLPLEDWPDRDRPRTLAYFCSTLQTPPGEEIDADRAAAYSESVRRGAIEAMRTDLAELLPHAVTDGDFRWELLCGAGGRSDESAMDTQFWTANVDPSELYVQSLPGTDRYRMRSDESGFENLYLAGDWTRNGIDAGCIEAAVLSGLKAGNALRGLDRNHEVLGIYLD